MKYTGFLLIVALLGLSGCATKSIDASSASEVPVDRMFWESAREKSIGKSEVIIKRDTGFQGGGCLQSVYFNGIKLTDLKPGEKVTFYVEPREYVIGAFFAGGFIGCASLLGSLVATIKPDSSNVFRIETDGFSPAPIIKRDNDISMELQKEIFPK